MLASDKKEDRAPVQTGATYSQCSFALLMMIQVDLVGSPVSRVYVDD